MVAGARENGDVVSGFRRAGSEWPGAYPKRLSSFPDFVPDGTVVVPVGTTETTWGVKEYWVRTKVVSASGF